MSRGVAVSSVSSLTRHIPDAQEDQHEHDPARTQLVAVAHAKQDVCEAWGWRGCVGGVQPMGGPPSGTPEAEVGGWVGSREAEVGWLLVAHAGGSVPAHRRRRRSRPRFCQAAMNRSDARTAAPQA